MSAESRRYRRLIKTTLILSVGLFLGSVVAAWAQSLGDLNRRLNELEPRVSSGVNNPQAASDVIDELDQAETEFARIVEQEKPTRGDIAGTYERLEGMLDRVYRTYQKQKDACIERIDQGGTCDYDQPEQLALRALYPLSWLRFEGASIYANEPARAKQLLNQAIDGFTDSSLLILSPELVRENLLGRAFAERELGKYDHSEYAKAIADFKKIMQDAPGSKQYQAAEQGLATTYAAMGKTSEAQSLSAHLAQHAPTQAEKNGMEMLHLRDLFHAEAAATDPTKRADLHREIVDYARARENDKDGWAIAVASAAQYANDPVADFGSYNDPFESWYLANVLYYKHQNAEAAKYYWEAAKSGKYPKAYRYAADLYYTQGRIDMVQKIADEIAAQPNNPDAPWAAYMRYKIPRIQWERSGMTNTSLEKEWVAGAEDYLKNYPKGNYAFEARFRLAERLQKQKDFVGAARQYEQVVGNPDYEFTARFNAADAYYQALGGKLLEAPRSGNKQPANGTDAAVRASGIKALREALALEPEAERDATPTQRKVLHDSRGRATYMLATLLESEPNPDYREIATILAGFETQYPAMKEHFNQTTEWRLTALDKIGDYAALERDVQALVARATVPADVDYMKEIGLDFWQSAQTKLAAGDHTGYVADARLTALTYGFFEKLVNDGKIPTKNLTGTLSILGQAYLAMNDTERGTVIFNQIVKADPGSPDANAGLAQIAQNSKNYRNALDLWTRVESVAAESDPLFYESKYHMAEIFALEGHAANACNKLTVTRGEHPNLGSPAMKSRWDGLQKQVCQNHTAG